MLTDNEGIQELNREYRKKDTPTDVLSFPQYAPGEPYPPGRGFVLLGDIIISAERADYQAHLFGYTFERELAFYVFILCFICLVMTMKTVLKMSLLCAKSKETL